MPPVSPGTSKGPHFFDPGPCCSCHGSALLLLCCSHRGTEVRRKEEGGPVPLDTASLEGLGKYIVIRNVHVRCERSNTLSDSP